MGRKLFVIFCVLVLGTLWGAGISAAQSTSPDGLKLITFKVNRTQANVGDTVGVGFKIQNVTDHPITISPQYGLFVGARWNSTTDANNRDFGHSYKGRVLQPGETIGLKAQRRVDAAGTWRFWPAYNVNGHWGPFRWNEMVVVVTAAPASPQKPQRPTR